MLWGQSATSHVVSIVHLAPLSVRMPVRSARCSSSCVASLVWRETKFWHDLIQAARRQCGIHHRLTCDPFTVRILAAWEQPLPVEYSTRVGGAVGKHGGQTAVGCYVRTAVHGIRKGAQCTGAVWGSIAAVVRSNMLGYGKASCSTQCSSAKWQFTALSGKYRANCKSPKPL